MSAKEKNLNISGVSEIKLRVLYADTDQMGVVYHATYLRWFEAGRAAHMRRRGISYFEVEKAGIILPVVEANLVYLKPARYDDIITVKSWLSIRGRVQLKFEYEIYCNDKLLVTGFTRHAAVNKEGRPTRIPDNIRDALAKDETITKGEID